MSELSPMELEKLILGYEDLEAAHKAIADHYLNQQPELAARLKWHQDKESQARNSIFGHDNFWNKDLLDPADEEAQLDSLRRILGAMETTVETRTSSLAGRLRGGARWILPLAAMLAVVILLPRDGGQKMFLQDLSITQIVLNADGSRGGSRPARAEGILHSGQAFALDFTLLDDAYVIVYHVGPKGQVSLVYPGSLTDQPVLLDGGRAHQIPHPDSSEVWVLGTETGTESFVMVIGSEWPEGFTGIRINSGSGDREAILADLRNQLEALMPQVVFYEFEHID